MENREIRFERTGDTRGAGVKKRKGKNNGEIYGRKKEVRIRGWPGSRKGEEAAW